VSLNIPLKIYIFTIVGIGLICFVYKTLLGRWLIHKIPYVVYEIEPKEDGILDILLTPEGDEILDFSPGQFVFIEFKLPGVLGQSHPFSISSAPSEKGFALTIKALGDFTNELQNIPKGTRALVEGPFGRFSPVYRRSHSYIWVAGGIGITPFLSMARSLLTSKPVDLYYVVRTEKEAIFLPELQEITKRIPTLRIIPWFTKQYGHLTSEGFIKYSPELFNSNIFVCGPPAMMKSTKKELRKAGVKSAHIHSEEFNMN
jgi:predicted ferric reductase